MSLGADVSLQVVVRAPERVSGLLLEMPVLEWAVPTAALLFTPLLLAMHYASGPAGFVARLLRRVPRTGTGTIDSVLEALSAPPEVVKAVLHGILTGPVAPTIEQRRADAPGMRHEVLEEAALEEARIFHADGAVMVDVGGVPGHEKIAAKFLPTMSTRYLAMTRVTMMPA